MKYKIGDKVRIKTWDQMEKEFGLSYRGSIDNGDDRSIKYVKEMEIEINNLNDRVLTISKIRGDEYYRVKEINYNYTDEHIEGLYIEKIYEPIHSRFEILDIRE